MKYVRAAIFALLTASSLLACSSPDPMPLATAITPGSGSLLMNITGLPNGVNANVLVIGSDGFSQPLTATKTISSLAPGSYTFTANDVTSSGFVYAANVTGSPATVGAGATATASVTYAAQVGSIKLKITGLPSGTKTDVTLGGPNGFSQTYPGVIGAANLENLPVGNYAISATPVRLVGSVVDLLFDSPTSSTVNVTAKATTAASLGYVPRSGATALWLPKVTGSVIAYAASKLGFGGNSLALPNITLGGATGGGNAAITFDKNGNLWALNSTTSTLNRFDTAKLGSSGTPTPAITITSSAGSLSRPASLAFDKNGNLWIANLGNDTIIMLTAPQLAQSGSPTPGLVIGANTGGLAPSLHGVSSLAFDKDGNLWALNASTPETVVRLSPDQLMRSGTPVPVTTISTSLGAGSEIAFDAAGNLWISDSGASTVVKYAAAQLTQANNPGPAATIHTINGSLSNPAGLAFDSSGNLWVANTGNNTLVEFAVDTLPTTPSADSPESASTISKIGDLSMGSIAFNPPPLNLPLAQVK